MGLHLLALVSRLFYDQTTFGPADRDGRGARVLRFGAFPKAVVLAWGGIAALALYFEWSQIAGTPWTLPLAGATAALWLVFLVALFRARVVLDDRSVTVRSLFRTRCMPLPELRRVGHRRLGNAVVLEGNGRQVSFSFLLRGVAEVHEVLVARLGSHACSSLTSRLEKEGRTARKPRQAG